MRLDFLSKAGILVVAALIVAVGLHPTAVQAAGGFNVSTSPLPIELITKPGTSISTELRVKNNGSDTEKLRLRLLRVTQDSEGGIHLAQVAPNDELVKWVKFSRPTFDAPSNEWQNIKMTVNVPKTAAFGYYFAVEYSRAVQEKPQPGTATANGAVATFILLAVDAPGANRSAEVTSFTADHRVYEFLPATFTAKVHANGNVHVAPQGDVFITSAGKQVASLRINSESGSILPGASRIYDAIWSNGFPHYEYILVNGQPKEDKRGNKLKHLVWDFTKLGSIRMGHYTAKMIMVYDDGRRDVPIEAKVGFWVIPWRLIGGLLVFLLLIGLGLRSSLGSVFKFSKRGRRR